MKEKNRIYLAGPINGCTDTQAKDWRATAKSMLDEFTVYDPMRRDFRGKELDYVDEIVSGDLIDINHCDIVLANVAKPSWGTAMEIQFAYLRGCVVVGFGVEGTPPSPWLVANTHSLHRDLSEAVAELKQKHGN